MKKYLSLLYLGILLIIAGCDKAFSVGGYPPEMLPFEQWEVTGGREGFCGDIIVQGKAHHTESESWLALFIYGRKFPFYILHTVKTRDGMSAQKIEYWIDLDSDGRIDQYFGDAKTYMARYADPCVLAKHLKI